MSKSPAICVPCALFLIICVVIAISALVDLVTSP